MILFFFNEKFPFSDKPLFVLGRISANIHFILLLYIYVYSYIYLETNLTYIFYEILIFISLHMYISKIIRSFVREKACFPWPLLFLKNRLPPSPFLIRYKFSIFLMASNLAYFNTKRHQVNI